MTLLLLTAAMQAPPDDNVPWWVPTLIGIVGALSSIVWALLWRKIDELTKAIEGRLSIDGADARYVKQSACGAESNASRQRHHDISGKVATHETQLAVLGNSMASASRSIDELKAHVDKGFDKLAQQLETLGSRLERRRKDEGA